MITDLQQINTDTHQGRLLMAAIAKITTSTETTKTPNEVIMQLNAIAKGMFAAEPKIDSNES